MVKHWSHTLDRLLFESRTAIVKHWSHTLDRLLLESRTAKIMACQPRGPIL
jgi:hypothetical protein